MKKIRLMNISSLYPAYTEKFYKSIPGLDKKTYGEQYGAVMSDCFGWADFWKKNLEETGRYEVFEMLMNAEALQKRWAFENGVNPSGSNWKNDIIDAQIKAFEPNVVFITDNFTFDLKNRESLKKYYPCIELIIGWDGIGLNSVSQFNNCDIVLSCGKFVVDYYRKNGVESYYLPYGFESTILDKLPPKKDGFKSRTYGVTFSGSLLPQEGYHRERLNLLFRLSRNLDLTVWSYTIPSSVNLKNLYKIYKLSGGNLKIFFQLFNISKSNQGGLFGLEMYKSLNSSKITINTHLDTATDEAGNMRLFEATGAGCCLVTDWKKNIGEFFKPDLEIVTYKSADECVDKIKFLLDNPEKMQEIAEAGHRRTLKDHTFAKRVFFLDEIIQKKIK